MTKEAWKPIRPKGERHGMSKLTEDGVLAIRAMFGGRYSAAELASRYDISTRHVYKIVNRKAWSHLP